MITSRDDTISELFTEIRGMVFNFARKFNLEFDDCLQEAMLVMLEIWPRLPSECTDIKAYLCGAARRQLYKFLQRRGQESLSLDMPIAPESEATFADMLQAFVQARDEEKEDFVEQVTHAALEQCKPEEQVYARDKYGLNSFNPSQSSDRPHNRREWNMKRSIKTRFSKTAQITALMQ